jgi:uncharacterized protein YbjT (DUF2867 family)
LARDNPVNILLFGATGMVGQGVLRECLLAEDVAQVLCIGRTSVAQTHPKLKEIVLDDLFDLCAIESELAGVVACFYCLGASSAGMAEGPYTRITYDLALAAAQTLVRAAPASTFVYVSGAGTDSSERGGIMWARVKGRTENALAGLPFRAVYLFRPGIIQPLHGIRSKTASYRIVYSLARPVLSLLRTLMPDAVLTTEIIGQAMLAVARSGAPKQVLAGADIRALASTASIRRM